MFGTVFGKCELPKTRTDCWSFGPAYTIVLVDRCCFYWSCGTGPAGYFEDCVALDCLGHVVVTFKQSGTKPNLVAKRKARQEQINCFKYERQRVHRSAPHYLMYNSTRHSVLKVITIGWSHLQSVSNKPLKIVLPCKLIFWKATKVGSSPNFPKLISQLKGIPQPQYFVTSLLEPHWTYLWKHYIYHEKDTKVGNQILATKFGFVPDC